MKAEIDCNGVLNLYPDSVTEGYAIKAWYEKSTVYQYDVVRNEDHHFKGSSIAAYYVKQEEDK